MDEGRRTPAVVLYRVLVVAVIAGVLILLAVLIFRYSEGAHMNPYEYSIEEFMDVPEELLLWDEASVIELDIAQPAGLAVDAQDRIFVAGAQEVAIWNAEGTAAGRFSTLAPARTIAIGPQGQIFVASVDHVNVYGPDGSHESEWTSLGEGAFISGMAATDDAVYLADAGSKLIWRFDTSGRLLSQIGRPRPSADYHGFLIPSRCFDVAAATDGALWITNPGRLRVEKYSPDGSLDAYWGEPSMGIEGFCGCCNPTHLAVTRQGHVVTSEKGLPRVKVYEPDGSLNTVVAGPRHFAPGTVGLDLAADSMGRVLVLDGGAGLVRIFVRRSEEGKTP